MAKIAVVALGGNAIIQKRDTPSIASQFNRIKSSLRCIIPLLKKKYQIVITHGNGPQVGNILIRVEEALGKAYSLPLEVCVAESQGEIGYMIEQSLHNLLQSYGMRHMVVTVLSQVVVDSHDPLFKKPTKPVGPYITQAQAEKLKEKGKAVVQIEDKYRRVVPSPRPKRIVESATIARLLKEKLIVITAGGGGIPVYEKGSRLVGIEAVVDKDLASGCLARDLKAKLLLILTDVDGVYQEYGKPSQKRIPKLTIAEAMALLKAGQLPAGSMVPKVEAGMLFVKSGKGRKAIITSLNNVEKALLGKGGTVIS